MWLTRRSQQARWNKTETRQARCQQESDGIDTNPTPPPQQQSPSMKYNPSNRSNKISPLQFRSPGHPIQHFDARVARHPSVHHTFHQTVTSQPIASVHATRSLSARKQSRNDLVLLV